MAAGGESGIHTISSAATNARRIEAGQLFSGTDFDSRVNPFAAGFGPMVDFRKSGFIGMDALKKADRSRLTWGLKCREGVPRYADTLFAAGDIPRGRITEIPPLPGGS
jgi:glycine cleavage system aminomethyltransferase T